MMLTFHGGDNVIGYPCTHTPTRTYTHTHTHLTPRSQTVQKLYMSPRHIYTMMLTFHGGDNVIGYEWGDYSNCQETGNGATCKPAPDQNAMHDIASVCAREGEKGE